MDYSRLVETYSKLESTSKRLEKTYIISELLLNTPNKNLEQVVYLLQGRVFPKWDERKIGIGSRLILKSISLSTGVSIDKIEKEWARVGDLGIVAENLLNKKKQTTLFSKKLTIEKIFQNLRNLSELEGPGTVSKKVNLVTELITSARPEEAKFIVRTVIEKLRLSVAEGVIRDSIAWTYFPKVIGIFFKCNNCKKLVPSGSKCLKCGNSIVNKFKKAITGEYSELLKPKSLDDIKKSDLTKFSLIVVNDEKLAREIYNYFIDVIQDSYNLTNDFGQVALVASKHDFKKLKMISGRPLNPMLAIKSESITDALKSVGSPALIESKLDGFRLQIHRNKDEIKLYTRRLENVTKQFAELIPLIKSNVKSNSFILDAEIVGYDPKTSKHLPFQFISQRIRRKYDIEKKSKEIPVEINVFDIMYDNGKSLSKVSQNKRRDLLEKIIIQNKNKIVLTRKIVSDNEREINKFYKESLKRGNEGIMIKNLEAIYIPGRKVGGWAKLKPIKETLDLVVTSADWGEGKRAKWLSSFTLSCRDKNNMLEMGKVGTGILEKEGELTFENLTKELIPLIISEKGKKVVLKPKIILEVAYEEIQKSTNYSSGYALRFPRVVRVRRDLGFKDVDTLERVKKFFKEYMK